MWTDLNADVGECSTPDEIGQYTGLLACVTSVSVACGFHAGTPSVMRATVELAHERGIAVGAHPSYQDREGFGRRPIQLPPAEIEDLVAYQVGALAALTAARGVRLQHVKPHGALYNMAAVSPVIAGAIARAVAAVDPALMLVGLSGSALIAAGQRAGLRTASEVFADRAYRADGTLVPRTEPGAVVAGIEQAAARAVSMVRDGRVAATDGTTVKVDAETICIHGDTHEASTLARAVRQALAEAGVAVHPMAWRQP